MTFDPAISYRPKQGFSDFEDHQIESENPRTSNGSAESFLPPGASGTSQVSRRHDLVQERK
jgi:hypothetical protein